MTKHDEQYYINTGKTHVGISPAVQAFEGKENNSRSSEIHAIIDKAAAELGKLGVKYFIGALDRQPQSPDGGKAYSLADVNGEDFVHILDMALPTRQDAVNVGIWVGHLIQARKEQN